MNHLHSVRRIEAIPRPLKLGLLLLSALLTAMPARSESLYQEGSFRPLTADNKAFRVGDALTVQVLENSSANTSVETGTRRNNDISASLVPGNGHAVGPWGIGAQGSFTGGGRTQRANRLLATLTVTVQEILPSGDLRVAGEQLLMVNDEQQRVIVEGRVRPLDIADSNVVLSTRIADARITYVGDGDVSERSRRGWWRKLLDGFGL